MLNMVSPKHSIAHIQMGYRQRINIKSLKHSALTLIVCSKVFKHI